MAVSDGYAKFIAEQLYRLGPVAIRRMFGGAGVSLDGLTFALIADDALYFKTDEVTRVRYESEGMAPFTYETSTGRNTLITYWQVPERLFDEADDMLLFAREAHAVALRSGTRAKGKKAAGARAKPEAAVNTSEAVKRTTPKSRSKPR